MPAEADKDTTDVVFSDCDNVQSCVTTADVSEVGNDTMNCPSVERRYLRVNDDVGVFERASDHKRGSQQRPSPPPPPPPSLSRAHY